MFCPYGGPSASIINHPSSRINSHGGALVLGIDCWESRLGVPALAGPATRLKAGLGPQTRYVAFGNPLQTGE